MSRRKAENVWRRISSTIAALLLIQSGNAFAQYQMTDYFPLPVGGTWTYELSLDGSTVIAEVIGTSTVNATPVAELDNGGGGVFSYSNDSSGLRLHRIETEFPSSTVTFSPPIVQASATANVGDSLQSSGSATFSVPGSGSFPLSYSATSTIETVEQVIVPAGAYDALRMRFSFTLTGTVNGTPVNDTTTSVLWLAEHVGVVRDDEGAAGILELTSTTVGPPAPLPPSFSGDFHDIAVFQPSRFRIADVDNDDNLDIVVVNKQATRQIATILGDGTGEFGEPIVRSSGSCSTCNRGNFALGDFDEDGNLDLAAVMRETHSVGIHLGDGAGNFADPVSYLYRINGQIGGSNPTDISAGDVNNDNDLDLVTVNFSSDDASVILGDGSGAFGGAQLFQTGFPEEFELADIDEDDNLDLVVARPADDDVNILFGAGDGTFGNAHSFGVGDFPRDLAVGDLNNDGNLDIVTANGGSEDVSVLLGNGTGGFAAAVHYDQSCPQFVSCFLETVALGDLNGDGNLDIVATDQETDEILVWMGRGDGSFGTATDVNTDTCFLVSGCAVSEVKTADFNEDGRLDIAVTYPNSQAILVLSQLAPDRDGDGVPDDEDAFPDDPAESADNDGDGIGDNADTDDDNDGVPDVSDAFPLDPNESADTDGDGVGDNADVFPNDAAEWADADGDGQGDNGDLDDDNDGIPDASDPYPVGRFSDVPPTFWAYSFVESLADAGITSGCGGGRYCANDTVTRAQMAVFLERGIRGSGYQPPAATGAVFADVAAQDFAAAWIELLAADGITSGCGQGNYCPQDSVTRAQMAVFILRAMFGAGHTPPAASGVFGDVGVNDFAAGWIEQLAAEGITSGCGNRNYCPGAPVTRAQMAVFLVRAFDL